MVVKTKEEGGLVEEGEKILMIAEPNTVNLDLIITEIFTLKEMKI